MSLAEDSRWMRMALTLASRSLGRVAPNPAVGAVLVRDGLVLGRGATADGGRPHAEAVALKQVRLRFGPKALAGATAFVSLEPCAHHGHTPPCAEALVEAGISRLVCPLEDPDPRVQGRGFAVLRAAGIEVEVGLMAEQARRLNSGFLSCLERQRPHMVLKLATTLDGRIATQRGESRWITGSQARARVHLMRAQSDAVMIGAGTARTDDPTLDARGLGPQAAQPVRIIVDGGLSLPPTGKLAASARDIPVWLLHRKIEEHTRAPDPATIRREALSGAGVQMVEVKAGESQLMDMTDAMRKLAHKGITRVLCEGGGTLAARLLACGLVDEIALFSAGKVVGNNGVPSIGMFGTDTLSAAPGFELGNIEMVGRDLLSVWRYRSDDPTD